MLVDDSSADRDLVRDALERAESTFVLTEASSRSEFEACLEDFTYDLVLSDFNILGFDGFAVMNALHDRGIDVPIIVVTGTGSEEVAAETIKRGAGDYVMKTPTQIKRLPLTILTVMEHRRLAVERREADERIRFQARLLDAAGQAIIAADSEGTVTYLNRAAEFLYGWSAAGAVGRNIVDVTVPEPSQKQAAEIMEALHAGEGWTGEFCVHHSDGTEFPVQVTDTPVYDEAGRLIGVIRVSFDITERRRSEKALRATRKQYEALFTEVPDAFALHEIICNDNGEPADYRFVEVNPSVEKLTGLTAADLIGKTVLEVLPGMDRSWIEKYGRVALTGEPIEFEQYSRDLNRFLGVKAFRTEPGFFATAFSDISERKLVENRLRESEARFRHLYGSVQAGVVVEDAHGDIMHANDVAAEILGLSEEELIGKASVDHFWQMIMPDGTPVRGEDHPSMITLRTGEPFRGEIRGLFAGDADRICWLSINTEPILNPTGKVAEVLITFHDITDFINKEKALRANEAALQEAQQLAGIGSFVLDLTTMEFSWSDELFRISGLEPGKNPVPLERLQELIHPDDRVVFEQNISQALSGTKAGEMEHRIVLPDGQIRHVHILGSTKLDEAGRPIEAVGTVQDITERKQAEEKLREKEKNLSLAQQIAHIGNWRYELASGALCWSDELHRVYGLDPETTALTLDLGMSLIHPDDRSRAEQTFRNAMAEKVPYVMDYRIIRPSGQERFVRGIGMVETDEAGDVVSMFGTGQDITEIKRATLKLEESEENISAIIDNSLEYILVVDNELNITFANRAAPGLTVAELIGKPLPSFAPEGQQQAARETLERSRDLGEVGIYETYHNNPDGSCTYFESRAAPRVVGGKVVGLTIQALDISERKQAEVVLKEREEDARRILAATTDGIWMWDFRKASMFFSDRYYTMLGYEPHAFPASFEAWQALIHPDDLERTQEKVNDFLQNNQDEYENEFRLRTALGEYRWIRSNARIVEREDSGAAVLLIGNHEDITERKQAENALRDREHKLQLLAARLQAVREEERIAIARDLHDQLGASLTGVKIDLDRIAERAASVDESIAEHAGSATYDIEKSMELVHEICQHLRPPMLDILGLRSAIEWYVTEFGQQNEIVCNAQLQAGEVQLEPDAATAAFRIMQEALNNVVRHAKATSVNVEFQSKDDGVELKVVDDGIGISDEQTRHGDSLGLLGMTERASVFGGSVTVCRGNSGGTVMTLTLPKQALTSAQLSTEKS